MASGDAADPYARAESEVKTFADDGEIEGDVEDDVDDLDEDDDDESPAGPKRKRMKTDNDESRPMSVSCELCKQRKVRCDRGKPQCGWCRRNGQVCEYKQRKKPGLRAGYGRQLESRLDHVEEKMSIFQQRIDYLAHALEEERQRQSQNLSSISPQVQTHLPPPAQRHLEHDHHQQLNHSYQRQHDPPPPAHYHASPASATSAMVASSYAPATSTPTAQAAVTPSIGPVQQLPPYDLLYALTDLFFKHVNAWCPILHRRSTLDALFGPTSLEPADRILLHAIVATTLRFSSDARLTPEARERYYASSKQAVLLYGLENSSVKALQALVILALDVCGISNGPPGWNLLALITRSVVQLGLAVETSSPTAAPLYMSIYTLRATVLPHPQSFTEDESRRRLFWAVYMLDRYATIATAFDFALDEKEIDRRMPCRDDLWSRNQQVETQWFPQHGPGASVSSPGRDYPERREKRPENMGSFGHYLSVLHILSRIHNFLKQPVDIGALSDVEQWQQTYRGLDAALDNWRFELPAEYSNLHRLYSSTSTGVSGSSHNNATPINGEVTAKPLHSLWIMLHITHQTAIIRLHSPAAYPATSSPIFAPSQNASARCLAAAEEICTICAYVSPIATRTQPRPTDVLTRLGPPFAFSLWVAARLLLVRAAAGAGQLNAHPNSISTSASGGLDPAIGPLVQTLRVLGEKWPVARRYAELLSRVLDEFRASQTDSQQQQGSVMTGTPASTPSTGYPHNQGHALNPSQTPDSVRILADMRRTAFDLEFLIGRQPVRNANGSGGGDDPAGDQGNGVASIDANLAAHGADVHGSQHLLHNTNVQQIANHTATGPRQQTHDGMTDANSMNVGASGETPGDAQMQYAQQQQSQVQQQHQQQQYQKQQYQQQVGGKNLPPEVDLEYWDVFEFFNLPRLA